MPDDDGGIPFLSSIGFSITARCPAACHHCIMEAGPHRKDEMSLADLRAWMEQAALYRQGYIKSVVITGGEPFYNLALLRSSLECAASLGLIPIVITNAYWATSLSTAIEILESLPAIRILTVSTDVHHQLFIPLANAKNALLAARALHLPHNAAVCFEKEGDPAHRTTKAELERVLDPRLVRSAPTLHVGRALRKLKAERFETTTDYPMFPCTAADYPTIFPDGKVIGCMGIVKDLPAGHPLLLGNVRQRPLADLLDESEQNTALHVLRVWGPGRLLTMLQEAGAAQHMPERYAKYGCCDLCYAMTADPELLTRLRELTGNGALAEKVAYARFFYLQEETGCGGWSSECTSGKDG